MLAEMLERRIVDYSDSSALRKMMDDLGQTCQRLDAEDRKA